MLAMLEYIDVEEINDQEIAVVKIKYALSADIAQVIRSYTASGPTSQRPTANTRPGSTGTTSRGGTTSRTGSNRFDSSLQPAIAQTRHGQQFAGRITTTPFAGCSGRGR